MPTKEQLAVCIASLKHAVQLRLWSSPIWVQELLTEYNNVVAEADAWRRTYNQVADSYRDLLASKPEMYLVDGQGAAAWARECKKETDLAIHWCTQYSAMYARHEALSTEYLALRADRDLWMARDNNSQADLQEWRAKYDSSHSELSILRKMYTELNTAYWRSRSEELKELKTKYDRLQRVATECEEELREVRLINS